MKNVAIILAGGTGSRFGTSTPKQLIKVAGKPIIEHTIDVFERSPLIAEIVIVMSPDHIQSVEQLVLKRGNSKVTKLLEGGKSRNESSLVAIRSFEEDDNCNVLFHDAVRPFLTDRIIEDCVDALQRHVAVDVAIESADTIIRVDGDYIEHIPPRQTLRRGQTPQGFHLQTIRKAYELALQDPDFEATDDCSVVVKYLPHEKVYLVEGEDSNIKITHAEDIFLADKLFQIRAESLDTVHSKALYMEKLQGKVLVIFGGSSGIGKEIAKIAREFGTQVFSLSRSETQTRIERVQDVEDGLRRVFTATGRIDYVVNTAAVLLKSPLSHMSADAVADTININLLGPANIARAAAAHLERSGGQLLFFTSSSYTRGRAFYSLYSSTKAGVVNLTQALAEEWSELGVRVNCINPERTKTPMRTRNFGNEPDESLLSAERVAYSSINTLVSDITGQIIDVRLSNN